jgi:hypothetical protein
VHRPREAARERPRHGEPRQHSHCGPAGLTADLEPAFRILAEAAQPRDELLEALPTLPVEVQLEAAG